MLSRLFIAAFWSPAGKRLTSWLVLVMLIVFFVTFPCGILGQVWYLIVSFPDLCRLSNFNVHVRTMEFTSFHVLLETYLGCALTFDAWHYYQLNGNIEGQ